MRLIAGFFQDLEDWGDLDPEIAGRVEASFGLTRIMRDLEQHDLWVFAAREMRRMEGGYGLPSPFPVALVVVRRATNSEIVKVDLSKTQEDDRTGG